MAGSQQPAGNDSPVKEYSNGIATFTYDSSALYCSELPSDRADGAPLTSFLLIGADDVLPRVDILPLSMEESFHDNFTQSDWEILAKALILAYYNKDAQQLAQINLADTVVAVDSQTSKMFSAFTAIVKDAPDLCLHGAVRLVSNQNKAVVTVALARYGEEMPDSLYNMYMSAAFS